MSVKTTGAEYKAYLKEQSAEWWPDGAYMDGESLLVDGKSTDEDDLFDALKMADSASLVIESGSYYAYATDRDPISLETHFKRWRKAQTVTRISVEVHRDKLPELEALLKSFGAKVSK